MMHTTALLSVREEFERKARQRERDRVGKDRDLRDREKRKEDQDARAGQEALEDVVAVLATSQEIDIALATCDRFDTATVEALTLNREALEAASERVRVLLDRAYVLPDGRRVFKTEDGTRIFDEHGTEVEDVDPDEIEDARPRWEIFKAAKEQKQALEAEREAILAYQARLDAARARFDEGEITKGELDATMADLREEMPDAVRAQLPDGAAPSPTADAATKPQGQGTFRPDPAARLDMPAL